MNTTKHCPNTVKKDHHERCISDQFEAAIASVLRENPPIEYECGTQEARTLAARYLA